MNSNQPKEKNETQQQQRLAETAEGRPVDPADQTLVAYLDGELSDAETDKVESDLMSNPKLRTRLRELQATWDMLDELPRGVPGESFLKSTIELAVTTSQKKRTTWHRWPLRITALAGAFLLTSVIAFQIVRSMQDQPYRQFMDDLDFLEYAMMYNQIQDVEFLEKLNVTGTFIISQENNEASETMVNLTGEQMLETLEPLEIRKLQSNNSLFQSMTGEQRERLREIHAELATRENRDELLEVMRMYSLWHKETQNEEKYNLKSWPIDERVRWVVNERSREAEEHFGLEGETRLPVGDVASLYEWWDCYFVANKESILSNVFGENAPQMAARFDDEDSKRMLFVVTSRQGELSPIIDAAGIATLKKSLSEEAVAKLDDVAGDSAEEKSNAQRKLVGRWLLAATHLQYRPQVDSETLIAYMETELDEETRKSLLSMSPNTARKRVEDMYFRDKGIAAPFRPKRRGKRESRGFRDRRGGKPDARD